MCPEPGVGDGHTTGASAWLTYVANAFVTAMVAVSFGNYASALFAGGNKIWAKIFAARHGDAQSSGPSSWLNRRSSSSMSC